ncbi:ABC transporter ATP-binding protein [bacterium]|jgi:lipoprotein-releasing system ATP-binding protein|nr:ABC transporter ATP-binding protein [bacterium]
MIQVQNLCVEFETPGETIKVLEDLFFELAEGESSAVVGPSGSGKTTFLNVLGAMLPATSGKVVIGDQDIAQLDEKQAAQFRNQKLGFIFQQHQLLPQLTVLENVLVPRLAGSWSENEEETRQRARKLLERVGLGHRLSHRPAELSGGEKQRTAVARALINQPKLVLADEPTGALDSETGDKVVELLLELQKEQGVTLIVVTHDLKLAERVGNIFEILGAPAL